MEEGDEMDLPHHLDVEDHRHLHVGHVAHQQGHEQLLVMDPSLAPLLGELRLQFKNPTAL